MPARRRAADVADRPRFELGEQSLEGGDRSLEVAVVELVDGQVVPLDKAVVVLDDPDLGEPAVDLGRAQVGEVVGEQTDALVAGAAAGQQVDRERPRDVVADLERRLVGQAGERDRCVVVIGRRA